MSTRGWEHATLNDVQHRRTGVQTPQVKSKYRNVKVVIDGQSFDSKREAAYWQGLLARQRAGEIEELARQVPLPLYAPDRRTGTGWLLVAHFVADFTYVSVADDMFHIVDAKSPATAKEKTYRLKKRWLELQDGIVIEEV